MLAAAEGRSNKDLAATLRITEPTVGKWRRRFLAARLDGLLDEPRPGAPRTIGDADVERVIALTLESAPRDATHWSTRSMAAASGYSQSSISRIWRPFALAPHRSETFKLSTDPLFIEKVRDIVGLYLAPPERALVLSVDEKTQIQALDRTAPMLPRRPGPDCPDDLSAGCASSDAPVAGPGASRRTPRAAGQGPGPTRARRRA